MTRRSMSSSCVIIGEGGNNIVILLIWGTPQAPPLPKRENTVWHYLERNKEINGIHGRSKNERMRKNV